MKKAYSILFVALIAVSSIITAQSNQKEKSTTPVVKSIPAVKIVPSPNQPAGPVKQEEPVLKVGMQVPDFEVPALENPKEIYSNKKMAGKIYLIDFWATWCGPCVGEMKILHEAYEKFKSKGLEIISFSCDIKPGDVAPFRKDKWAMPWKHVFFGKGKDCLYPKIKEDFGIKFIPSPFLIDKDGKILAMHDELRGEKLIKTLEKFVK